MSDASAGIRRPLTLSFGASAVIQAMNVMTGVLLARTLGPEGRGALAAVLLWPSLLAAVGSLGVSEAVTFHIARPGSDSAAVLGTGLALACVQALVCCAIGAAIIPPVLSHYEASTLRAAYMFLLFIPANLLTLTMMSAINGLQRFGEFHALRLAVITLTCSSLIALRLMDNLTLMNAAIVYVGATVIVGVASATLLLRSGSGRLAFSLRVGRGLLGYGLKAQTGSVTWMMNERLDQLIISIFLAPARLGLYVTAVTMTSLINLVGSSIATAAFPVVANLRDAAARRDAARRFVRLALFASFAVAIPLIVVAPIAIDVFFKDVYSGAANVARVLMLAAVVLSTNRALGACLKAMDRPLDTGIAEILALGVTAGGLALMLPSLGIMGAAIASLAAYSVSTAWMLHRTARVLEVRPAALLLPDRGDISRLFHRPLSRGSRRQLEAAEVTPS